jgi:hypothetical protein
VGDARRTARPAPRVVAATVAAFLRQRLAALLTLVRRGAFDGRR